jgi:hypothetical protein
MNNYIVNRRETIVIPKAVADGSRVNFVLNIIFLTWSVLTIIMYFASVDVPDFLDIGVSILAIAISLLYQIYKYYIFKKSKIYKIFDDPDLALKRKNESKENNRRVAIKPIQNVASSSLEILNLNDIQADF